MGDKEYRATLEIRLESMRNGVKGMTNEEFAALVGLLGSTAEAIEKEVARMETSKDGNRGFGSVGVKGEIEGVGVEALWTFYEFDVQTRTVKRCA